ncbi:hypothetical protein Tco_0492089 [Tanacetum coccineum]
MKPVTSHSSNSAEKERNSNVIAQGMFRIDSTPVNSYFRKNKNMHKDYLDATKKRMAELQDLLHHASTSRPSDKDLEYACKIADRNQESLYYACVSCPSAHSGRVNLAPITWPKSNDKPRIVQIVLWYLDSGCLKHMTGWLDQLVNFVSKFMGTVRFENDHFAAILGYGDLQIGNIYISQYFKETPKTVSLNISTTTQQDAPSSMTTDQDAPSPTTTPVINKTRTPHTSNDVEEHQ